MFTKFAMVRGMSDEQIEPGDLTERFRAFAQSADPAPSRALPVALIVAGVATVLAVVVVIWMLLAT